MRASRAPTRSRAIVPAACLCALVVPASASAGWTPPEAPLSTTVGPVVVAGGAPGQVAVAGIDGDSGGAVLVGLHPPGSPWRAAQGFGGDESFDPMFGDGGAVVSATDANAPRAWRIGADGGVTDLGVATPDAEPAGVATDVQGTTLVAAVDDDGHLLLARRGAADTGFTTPKGWDPKSADAETAAVSARAGGGFLVVRVTSGGSVVATVVDPGGTATPAGTLGAAAPGTSISTVAPTTAGTGVGATWLETGDGTDDDPGPQRILAAQAGSPQVALQTYAPTDSIDAVDAVEGPDGALQAFWTVSPASGSVTTMAAVSGGAERCRRTFDLAQAGRPQRRAQGTVLAGVQQGTQRFAAESSGPSCQDLGSSFGATAPGALDAGTGVDAEGSVVVAASLEDGRTIVSTLDETPPSVAISAVGEPVGGGSPIKGAASDAWGVGSVRWTLDGSPFSTAADAALPSAPAGDHRLGFAATDLAGNAAAGDERTVRFADDPVPPPPIKGLPPVVPPVAVDVPGSDPDDGAEPTRTPRPRLRIRSVTPRTDGSWTVRLRVHDVSKVYLALYRETYRRGPRKDGRPPTCPRRPVVRRPPVGLRGTSSAVVRGSVVTIELSEAMAEALTERGRYTLSAVGRPGGSTARASDHRRFTVC